MTDEQIEQERNGYADAVIRSFGRSGVPCGIRDIHGMIADGFKAGAQRALSLQRASVKERRLNIAAMAMQGILSNPQLLKIAIETYQEEIGSPDIYVAVAKTAKEQADALIAECEKGDSDEKD